MKGINTKLAHHDKMQLQDKGHNSESYSFGKTKLKKISKMMAPDRKVLVPHAVLLLFHTLYKALTVYIHVHYARFVIQIYMHTDKTCTQYLYNIFLFMLDYLHARRYYLS